MLVRTNNVNHELHQSTALIDRQRLTKLSAKFLDVRT